MADTTHKQRGKGRDMSIGRRIALFSIAVIVLTVLALTASAIVGGRLLAANDRILQLSMLLNNEEAVDGQQRTLRTRIGDTTRRVERGETVPLSEWNALDARITGFADRSAKRPEGTETLMLNDLAEVDTAEQAFAAQGRRLITEAQRGRAHIAPAMGEFIAALNALESKRTIARNALAGEIKEAADQSLWLEKLTALSLALGGLSILGVVGVLLWWTRTRMIGPVTEVAHNLRALGRNEPVQTLAYFDRADEIGDLARGLAEYRASIESRRDMEARFHHLAHHDPLTDLANRVMLSDALDKAMRAPGEYPTALLALDLDGFKAVNDALGHVEGDRMLCAIADTLAATCRDNDIVARIGGDEFVILQTGSPQPEAAMQLAQRLVNAVADTTQDAPYPVGVSVGIALGGATINEATLMANADAALYRAKANGMNSIRFFDDALNTELQVERTLAADASQALSSGQLSLDFVPMIACTDHNIVGWDCQLRWMHPTVGSIPTRNLMTILADTGAMPGIGRWMIDQACRQFVQAGRQGVLTITLPPSKFRRRGLSDMVRRALTTSGLAPDRLQIAISEAALQKERRRDQMLAEMNALRALGVRIALDDFGTAESALGRPLTFRFDMIRLASELVVGMDRNGTPDPTNLRLLQATLLLGNNAGADMCARDLPDRHALERLCAMGCRWAQLSPNAEDLAVTATAHSSA